MPSFLYLLPVVIIAIWIFLCRATKRATRPTNGSMGDPPPGTPNAKAWYIESKPVDGILPYSCSFVEFDERGDYLDFRQQRRSWKKIKELAVDKKQKLLVVIYCHGWKNNSQSGNVVDFNRFLGRLASSSEVKAHGLRVHGLYLAWRANVVRPFVERNSEAFRETEKDFAGPIVDEAASRKFRFFTPAWLVEQVSYWSRKAAAESRVSGVPIARTICTAANAAKHFSGSDWTNRVFVIGHSFGALMLEKSLGQACVGALTDQWKWSEFQTSDTLPPTLSTLPFDCILFVNSAAPSIHAKELADLLWAHESAQERSHVKGAEAPVIISITSSADWATRIARRWANVLARFYPSLRRKYTEGILKTTDSSIPPPAVPQSYFYKHTPGHNPLLVNRWTVRAEPKEVPIRIPQNTGEDVLAENLNLTVAEPSFFFTAAHSKNASKAMAWKIVTESEPPGWSQYKNHRPVQRGNYWFIRCGKPLIATHDAIWTPTAMELYAALYRIAEMERRKQTSNASLQENAFNY